MWRQGATVLVLRPGQETLRFELSERWRSQLVLALLVPVLIGATGRRGWEALGPPPAEPELAEPVTAAAREAAPRGARGSAEGAVAATPERSRGPTLHGALALAAPTPTADPRVVAARPIVASFRARAAREPGSTATDAWADPTALLSVRAVHLAESVSVRPFDERGAPLPEAFSALDHLMRCRVTGEQVATDPQLVRVLARLAATYARPIQLVSGHRAVHALGTKETSQHAQGRAADIRVAGVSIEALRERAIELGARGVGLYPEKGFVHVDVRPRQRFFWAYTEATGEVPYERFMRGSAEPTPAARTAAGAGASGEAD